MKNFLAFLFPFRYSVSMKIKVTMKFKSGLVKRVVMAGVNPDDSVRRVVESESRLRGNELPLFVNTEQV